MRKTEMLLYLVLPSEQLCIPFLKEEFGLLVATCKEVSTATASTKVSLS